MLGLVTPRALILLAWLGALGPGPAHASDSASENPAVVVTANRVAENAQDVPMSISVVSAAVADQLGITDTQSLAAAVPGLLSNREANVAIPFVRGVGSSVGQAGDEPSVALRQGGASSLVESIVAQDASQRAL